jgi:hypothetical protein
VIVSVLTRVDVRNHWPRLKPFFEQFVALSHGEATERSLRGAINSGNRQCWVCFGDDIDAVALTEITSGGVWLDFCAGKNMKAWRETLLDEVKGFSDRESNGRVKVFGRAGWDSFMREQDFKPTYRLWEYA